MALVSTGKLFQSLQPLYLILLLPNSIYTKLVWKSCLWRVS